MLSQENSASAGKRLSFFVDHIFRTGIDGEVYTIGGKFPAVGWRSYLKVFEHLTVVSRVMPIEDASTLSISSAPSVDFVASSPHRGVKRLFDLSANRKIVRGIVQRSDAVVARLPSELGLLACQAAHEMKKPLLIEMVACPWDSLWNRGSWASRAYAPILKVRTKLAVQRAPIVRYVTANFLQDRYPTEGKVFVASNVELTDNYMLHAERTPPNAKRRVVFGTIGSLNTRLKGIHSAIEALRILRQRRPSLTFEYRVLGEGHFDGVLEDQESDLIKFEGTLPGGKPILDWLEGIDIYLQPSFQEGLPRSLIEALSRGCICVGSTAGGIPELLGPERLHTPGNPQELADKIDAVLREDEKNLIGEIKQNLTIASRYTSDRLMAVRVQSLQALRDLTHRSEGKNTDES